MISLAADVGGTFTDVVLVDSTTGRICIEKVPSTPGSTAAIVAGIESLTQQAEISPADIDVFIHGFTIATNAWLTRTGARTVLAVAEVVAHATAAAATSRLIDCCSCSTLTSTSSSVGTAPKIMPDMAT